MLNVGLKILVKIGPFMRVSTVISITYLVFFKSSTAARKVGPLERYAL